MASKISFSPLFSPRPHILGLGRLLIKDIFLEFVKISPLTPTPDENSCTTDKVSKIHPDMQDLDTDEPAGIGACAQSLESSNCCGNMTVKPGDDHAVDNQAITAGLLNTNSKESVQKKGNKYPTCIIDRDTEGNEKMIPYKFNEMTLRIFDIFLSLNIPYETEVYKPKEERLCVDASSFYCRNLFLKDRKGQYFLVICHEDTNMDLKHLRKLLKAHRNFNFVVGEEMKFLIGTDPGGVTPLALIFASALDVSMVISRSLYKEGASLMFHPLDSSIATKISMPNLLRQMDEDIVGRLPQEWQKLFKYLDLDKETAEALYNDMMFSQYGSHPEWAILLKALSAEDPYIHDKQLLFKPRLLLLSDKLQEDFLSFLLTHCSRIPDACIKEFISSFGQHQDPKISSNKSLLQLAKLAKVEFQLTVKPDSLYDKKQNVDNKLRSADSDVEVIVIDEEEEEDYENPLKRPRLDHEISKTAEVTVTIGQQGNQTTNYIDSMVKPGVQEDVISDEIEDKVNNKNIINDTECALHVADNYEEENGVAEDITDLARRLKDAWMNGGTEIPRADLEELSALSVKEVEFICQKVDFSILTDENIFTICEHINTVWENFSFSTIVCLLRQILCERIQNLTQNASRQLLHAITMTAGKFQKQFIDAVMVPGFASAKSLSSHQCDIHVSIIKELFISGTRLYLLQQLVTSYMEITDHSLAVLQCVIDCGCDFDEHVFSKFLEILHGVGQNFAKNLKFGKLLLSIANKHGKDMKNRDLLENLTNTHRTFMKKTILSVLKKLQS